MRLCVQVRGFIAISLKTKGIVCNFYFKFPNISVLLLRQKFALILISDDLLSFTAAYNPERVVFVKGARWHIIENDRSATRARALLDGTNSTFGEQVFCGYGAGGGSFRKLETLSWLSHPQSYRSSRNHRRERGRSFTSVALVLAEVHTVCVPLTALNCHIRWTDEPSFGETVIVAWLNAYISVYVPGDADSP